MTAEGYGGLLLRWWTCFGGRDRWCSHNIENLLIPIKLFTLEQLTFCYVNVSSKKRAWVLSFLEISLNTNIGVKCHIVLSQWILTETWWDKYFYYFQVYKGDNGSSERLSKLPEVTQEGPSPGLPLSPNGVVLLPLPVFYFFGKTGKIKRKLSHSWWAGWLPTTLSTSETEN